MGVGDVGAKGQPELRDVREGGQGQEGARDGQRHGLPPETHDTAPLTSGSPRKLWDSQAFGGRATQTAAGGDCFGARKSSASSPRETTATETATPSVDATESPSAAAAGGPPQSRRDACTGQAWSSLSPS